MLITNFGNDDLSILFQVEVFKTALLMLDTQAIDENWQHTNFKELLCGGTINFGDRQCALPLNIIAEVFQIALETSCQDIPNMMWFHNVALQNALLADFEIAQCFLQRALVFAIKTENMNIVNDCIDRVSDIAFLKEIQLKLILKINFSDDFKNQMKQILYIEIEKKINRLRAARLFLTPELSVSWEFDDYQEISNEAFAKFFPDRDILIKGSIEHSEDLDFLIKLRDSLSQEEMQFKRSLDKKISCLIEKYFLREKEEYEKSTSQGEKIRELAHPPW